MFICFIIILKVNKKEFLIKIVIGIKLNLN